MTWDTTTMDNEDDVRQQESDGSGQGYKCRQAMAGDSIHNNQMKLLLQDTDDDNND